MSQSADLAARFGLTQPQLEELRQLLASPVDPKATARKTTPLATWSPEQRRQPLDAGQSELPPRYEHRGLLGVGGMGEVLRVWDTELKRTVAMKILRAELSGRGRATTRFVEEAQTSAQLQHPGVLPVYELGRLPDGRLYFTMQEIRGRTLGDAIDELHRHSTEDEWRAGPSGVGFRRLIEAMRTVCEAVGYAHRRGVVHRDLKPANILLGDDGEVLVVDWGIAKIQEAAELSESLVTDRGVLPAESQGTSLTGTPAYMPPEQAHGTGVGPQSDVWALGAVLYTVLVGSHPHSHVLDLHQLLAMRMAGYPPTPIRSASARAIPEELIQAVDRALRLQIDQRQANGAELAAELGVWLDGERRRARGRALVAEAQACICRSESLADQAERADQDARTQLQSIDDWAPEEHKLSGWQAEDQAQELRRQAERQSIEAEQLLHTSLTAAPDLIEAREALAVLYRARHNAAENRRDDEVARRAEAFLRTQVQAMPPGDTRVHHQRYLDGTGTFSLVTDPPGAEVILHRYDTHRRRLVARADRVLGATPIAAKRVPPGSWLAVLQHPDCEEVRYPIQLDRLGHWDGTAPDKPHATAIPLPAKGSLTASCYVPPGWFRAGGDADAPGAFAGHRRWCDGFVIDRDPATNRDWLAFVNAIAASDGIDAAWRLVPTDFSGIERDDGIAIYRLAASGLFELGPDPDGDVWELDWPVVMITMSQVARFVDWRRSVSGQPWRLPADLEWEKAARGVDGRIFPWGDRFDPSWAVMRDHRPIGLAPVGDHPVDTSVYGVRGMAGNAADWCLEQAETVTAGRSVVIPDAPLPGDRQVGRGGSWSSAQSMCRSASRGFCYPNRPLYSQGVRLVRSWPPTTK